MKRLSLSLFLCAWVGLATAPATASAVPTPPDQLVKDTTNKVVKELADHRDELKNDSQKLYQMVNQVVLPHFDFERMSRYVLGRYWRQANPEQQKKFVEQFKTLLVRTYATALFQYTGQKITYKPFHHDEASKRAVVQTEVERSDGPPIPIDYSLSLDNDEWKVYDIKIDNLSLVTNYRSQYGEIVQTQGMDKLISDLSKKNQEPVKQ